MVIGIDASRALRPNRTGTEVYNAEIIKHLIKHDSKNTYRLYASREPSGDMLDLGPNVEWRVMPFPRGWTLFRLSWEIFTHPPDVFFIPAHTLPLWPGRKAVVMIHDIGFDHFPSLYKWTDIAYHRFDVRFAKLFAKHILTPSDFTTQDLQEKYGLPKQKITRIFHGFNAGEFHPAPKDEKSPRNTPYFYFVGRLEYKKNVVRMIEAFGQFKRKTGLPHEFLFAGRPAHGYDDILKAHEALGPYKADAELLGYTSQADSTRYMRHAEAFVFPTLFEGFGIPVLEAFASDTPVITANTTSLPEVAGNAAILVDPTDTAAIAAALEKVARDAMLRQDMIAKGRQQYQQFSWDKAARETLAVLERASRA